MADTAASKPTLHELLRLPRPLFLDGAMGTLLMAEGLPAGKKPEYLNVESPRLIESIHSHYLEAGADILYTNTFGANPIKFNGDSYRPLIRAAIQCARAAVDRAGRGLIALDMGSLGQLLSPMGSLSHEEAYRAYKEVVLTAGDGVDLFAVETLSDLMEAKCAVLAIRENSDKPIFVTMSFEEGGRTFSGCPIASMVATLEGLGVTALGMNCSLGPDEAKPLIEPLLRQASCPVIVKPNAGLPVFSDGQTSYPLLPEAFADTMSGFVRSGVKIVGGCCGTTPDFIRALSDRTRTLTVTPPSCTPDTRPPTVASATRCLSLDQPRIVGERINPTGKPLMKRAIVEGDFPFILKQAIEQVEAGADILDVNMGVPNTDEKAAMLSAVHQLSAVVDAPLQIDSSDPEVIEAALRRYPGKAIVNSVNGKEESLNTLLPIIKKYGAMVIGLTLDEKGIPQTAEARIAIAKRIAKRAADFGIPKSDLIIDCLTLTAGAEQPQARETLKALRLVRETLHLKTTLGVSNISFGLPRRPLINKSFLLMALMQGLDLPIINPNSEDNMEAVFAYRLLMNIDKNGEAYIRKYAQAVPAPVAPPASSAPPSAAPPAAQPPTAPAASTAPSQPLTLESCILKSLEAEALQITGELLKTAPGLTIIEEKVIPALNTIGSLYESKRLFLPQLISCSQVAKSVCDRIKTALPSGSDALRPVTVILATVQGDIHDIGKNIVKTVLQNYGYSVIDCGKDVPPEAILSLLHEKGSDSTLVGLSALMTTTVVNMKATIRAVKKHFPNLPVAVGGAVLTADVAKEIGADAYTKDPQAMVRLLETLFPPAAAPETASAAGR